MLENTNNNNQITNNMLNHKKQTPNYKQIQNANTKRSKTYDLEDRTKEFARSNRDFVKKLTKSISNIEYGKQLIRSSGSQAANYIEANEALSKKDFVMRVKICRKEAKESRLWLELSEPSKENQAEKELLIKESLALTKIFSSIIEKSK